jgi:hypothetical protein
LLRATPARACPGGPKRFPLGVEVEYSSNRNSGNGRNCHAAAGDIRPIQIAFEAEHDSALLDLRTDGAADHSPTYVEAIAVESGDDQVGRVLLAPTPTAVHTDIEAGPEAGPIIDCCCDRRWRRLDSEVSRMRGERRKQRSRANQLSEISFH